MKVAGSLAVAGAVCAALLASGSAATGDGVTPCPRERIRTASGCTSLAAAGREIRAIVERSVQDNDLRAALVRVDLGDRSIARVSAGESMDGVPANLRMNFRIGSVAIPYVIDLLLKLQDDGRLSLDDRLSNWFPDLPDADRVTLRMLATATSGYADWIQEDPAWVKIWYANVFRQWQTRELLDIALARPRICDPGTCFHYAHTNFIILGNVIEAVTGKPVAELLRRRVLRPLGLRNTRISSLPDIPPPVLHAYTADRGPYEDSTFWSPSWSIAESMIMTSTIGDVIKSAQGARYGSVDLQGRRARAHRPDDGGAPGVQPEPLLRARRRDREHLGNSEPRDARLHRDPGLSAVEADLGRSHRHERAAGGRHRDELQRAAVHGDHGISDAGPSREVLNAGPRGSSRRSRCPGWNPRSVS